MSVLFKEVPFTISIHDVLRPFSEQEISSEAESYIAVMVTDLKNVLIKTKDDEPKYLYALMKIIRSPKGKMLVPAFGKDKSLHVMEKFSDEIPLSDIDVEEITSHIPIMIIIQISDIPRKYPHLDSAKEFKPKLSFVMDKLSSKMSDGINSSFATSLLNDEDEDEDKGLYEAIIRDLYKAKNKLINNSATLSDIEMINEELDGLVKITRDHKAIIKDFEGYVKKAADENRSKTSNYDKLLSEVKTILSDKRIYQSTIDRLEHLKKEGVFIGEQALSMMKIMSASNRFYEWTSNFESIPFYRQSAQPTITLNEFWEKIDASHYGMHDVKRVLTEEVAYYLKGRRTDHVICLNGAPGVGKTSIANAFAKAMNREFFTISLGGSIDATELFGFQPSWSGATPGRIMKNMMMCGTTNPVILIDEIDKASERRTGNGGDVKAALLELFDPKQRTTYTDRYFGFPYDMSDVTIIATSNYSDRISPELKDRMRMVDVPSYSNNEKFLIAKDHVLPELAEKAGFKPEELGLDDDMIRRIISEHTFEAGCRGMEKKIGDVVRNAVVREARKLDVKTTGEILQDVMGTVINKPDTSPMIGKINGLSVSAMGGAVMRIEAALRRSDFQEKQIILSDPEQKTGNMRLVMLESISVAKTALISNMRSLGISNEEMILNAHVHAGAAATPKDGPSAGLAISMAILSAITKRVPKQAVAMTGEISLSGDVMAIGGVRDKVFGAMRSGITTVIVPKSNYEAAMCIPEEDRDGLTIIPVSHMEEAVKVVFGEGAWISDSSGISENQGPLT